MIESMIESIVKVIIIQLINNLFSPEEKNLEKQNPEKEKL